MELGYLLPSGRLVTVDTIGWRTLFPAITFLPSSGLLHHLTATKALDRRVDVTISVGLHRRGWARRGEVALRRTRATWYRGGGLDLFIGPRARSIRVPWRGELTKVHRPFFALEEPIKAQLAESIARRDSPSIVWLDRATVRGCRRSGHSVEVFAVERKEFSDFVLGKLRAVIAFPSEADAVAFADGLPAIADAEAIDRANLADLSRSKWIVWTPKVFALTFGGIAFFVFVVAGTIVGAFEGDYRAAAGAALEIALGLSAISWALPLLLRTRRKEFLSLIEKWPRALCERWGLDYRNQAARVAETLREMGVLPAKRLPDLMAVDAFLRSRPPETFYGTFALQLGLFAVDHLVRLVGREMEFWWEYLPDRRECAFRVEAAGLRVYPLTAIMSVWQMRDPETLDLFIRSYARELQMRLAFRESLPLFVALGFTAPGWEAFSKFAPRVDGELSGRARSRLLRAEDETFRESVLDFDSVRIVFLEMELPERPPRFVPVHASPFLANPGFVSVTLSFPVEFEGRFAALCLGAFPDRILTWSGALARPPEREEATSQNVELCGVVGNAHSGIDPAQEVREARVPSIAYDEPIPEAIESPRALVRARVLDVEEGTNALGGVPLWRVVLDLAGAPVPVASPKAAWPTPPAAGDLFVGEVWFLARSVEAPGTG